MKILKPAAIELYRSVYFPAAGERLVDLCFRFKASPKEIMHDNGLIDGDIALTPLVIRKDGALVLLPEDEMGEDDYPYKIIDI